MVADQAQVGIARVDPGHGLLQVADRRGRDPAPIQHPAERVRRVRVVRHQRLRLLREVEGAIQVLLLLGVDVGEVVLRLAQVRLVFDGGLVVLDRALLLPAVLVEHAEEVMDLRLVGLDLERPLVGLDRLARAPGARVELGELAVAGDQLRGPGGPSAAGAARRRDSPPPLPRCAPPTPRACPRGRRSRAGCAGSPPGWAAAPAPG